MSKTKSGYVSSGRQVSPLLMLCDSFSKNPKSNNLKGGCPAIQHIQNAEYIDEKLRQQLYDFKQTLTTEDSMEAHVSHHGITRTLKIGFTLWPDEFRRYLSKQARLLTKERIIAKQITFYRAVFNIAPTDFRCGDSPQSKADFENITSSLYEIIGEEGKYQQDYLPRTNASAMRMDHNQWTLFWVKADGTSLQKTAPDFSKIKNPHFRCAFMYWLKEKKWRNKTDSFRGHSFSGMIAKAFNFLSEEVGVATPADVKVTHVRRLVKHLCVDAQSFKENSLAMSSVRSHFKIFNPMFDWLMREDVVIPDGQPPVTINPFRAVSFKNEDDHTKSAEYIPEEVVAQIQLHQDELPADVNRCWKVMMEGGLRFKDAVMLEAGCLTFDDDLNLYILKFIQYKTQKKRAKKGLDPYHQIGIKNLDVVRAIQEQHKASSELREKTDTKLIFIRKPSTASSKVNVLSATGFIEPIRRLILKHHITDHDGNLWKFDSHQCRKTVAVDMVENGASPIEVRQFLGHYNQKTTDGIYAEVRKKRLAQMNHGFFEKKFKAKVSDEQLSNFSEEERRVLYLEFALGHREVELGKCIKHASEGPCGKRTGTTNCAICKNICSGPQYERKWLKLVEDAEREVTILEEIYQREEIPKSEYSKYREYDRASKLLRKYRAALNEIQAYVPR
jgi:site-specific recombinase XerD